MCLLSDEIVDKFVSWLAEAQQVYEKLGLVNFNAFSLATSSNNEVSSRIILLKDFSAKGLVFYTNLNSFKANQITINHQVAANFYWEVLNKQVRVQGAINHYVDDQQADSYFASRPYLSKISALASEQSRPLHDYNYFITKVLQYAKQFPNNPPRPQQWGGYVITPYKVEFWEEKRGRMHHRLVYSYSQVKQLWEQVSLYP